MFEDEKENDVYDQVAKNGPCMEMYCIKSFCRSAPENIKIQVQKILNQYGKLFSCKNVQTILENKNKIEIKNKNMYLELYLYMSNFCAQEFIYKKFSPIQFGMKGQKPLKINSENNAELEINTRLLTREDELNHEFCRVLYLPLEDTDSYILVGVLQLMLHKFQKSPNFLFGLVILRIFNVVCEREGIVEIEYAILYSVYNYIYQKITDEVTGHGLQDSQNCKCGLCLFHLSFTAIDLISSVKNITKVLDECDLCTYLNSKKILYLFEILRVMHMINLESSTLHYDVFYLYNFYNSIDIKEEFRKMKSKKETPIVYKFTMPVHKKAELLKLENCDKQRTSLQESFFRALFEGLTDPYLVLKVRREFIYEDTLEFLSKAENCDFRKQLKISFLEEEGVDSGGIIKEFFQLLSHKISEDSSIFTVKNNYLWLKPDADQQKLKLLGIILGIALYNNVVLSIPLSPLLFKKFYGDIFEYSDLKLLEKEIYNSLESMNDFTNEQFEELELTFEVSIERNGNACTYPLLKNGGSCYVTRKNYNRFKHLLSDFYINKAISNEFNEVLDGFFSVISSESIDGMNHQELEKIIMGTNIVNFMIIKEYCVYQGYTESSPVVVAFWQIVESMDKEFHLKLLKFITGNDRLPIGGASSLKFTIMKNGCDTERLPSAQTCFNTLLIPEYSTGEKLMEKLYKAIEMTAGFYLM